MGCRKNITKLTPAERTAFVNAVNALRTSGGYATFVTQHQGAMGHGHGGPAFFPWHREFILRFERALQAIDSSVNLPYWDWTVENLNASGTESLLWRNDLMGGPGNPASGFRVTTGPFAAWNIVRNNFNIFASPGGGGSVATALTRPTYTQMRTVEGPHGSAHVWVGGDMQSPPTAVRDPVFFLLHCNVDRLWSEWIRLHRSDAGFTPYEPASGGPLGHNLNNTMWPWNGTTSPFGVLPWTVSPQMRRPADQLDHRALGYFYDTIDPECRIVKVKERLPKELIKEKEFAKERAPKEFIKEKERLPKEFKESIKERLPKEIREFEPKQIRELDPKGIREIGPFIPGEFRPDLAGGALRFESDVDEAELEALAAELRERGQG